MASVGELVCVNSMPPYGTGICRRHASGALVRAESDGDAVDQGLRLASAGVSMTRAAVLAGV